MPGEYDELAKTVRHAAARASPRTHVPRYGRTVGKATETKPRNARQARLARLSDMRGAGAAAARRCRRRRGRFASHSFTGIDFSS